MALKQVIVPLTVIILILTIFSFLGVQPAQMVSTPQGIHTPEVFGGEFVCEIAGVVELAQSSYDISLNEFPLFPLDMTITADASGQETDTGTDNGFILDINGQLRAYINDVIVYDGWFVENLHPALFPDYAVVTIPFTPSVADSSGVKFSDLSFIEGDVFRVDLFIDGHVETRVFIDDEFGGYFEFIDWGMRFSSVVASWEATIIDSSTPDDDDDDDIIEPGTATIRGYVQDLNGISISSVSIRMVPGPFAESEMEHSTTSDTTGDYIIADIPSGEYTLFASKSGYGTHISDIILSADESEHHVITIVALDDPPLPPNLDTDGDGFTDAEEIEAGTDPLDPDSFPEADELPPFDWNIWVIILLIAAFVVAIAIFIGFKGGLMGGIFAAISFLVLAVVAWIAGSGLLVGG